MGEKAIPQICALKVYLLSKTKQKDYCHDLDRFKISLMFRKLDGFY